MNWRPRAEGTKDAKAHDEKPVTATPLPLGKFFKTLRSE
jgi:hypothetical protein